MALKRYNNCSQTKFNKICKPCNRQKKIYVKTEYVHVTTEADVTITKNPEADKLKTTTTTTKSTLGEELSKNILENEKTTTNKETTSSTTTQTFSKDSSTSKEKTTTTKITTWTTTDGIDENSQTYEFGKVYKIPHFAYDSSRGAPTGTIFT
jgi:hypothetical protein